MIDIVICGFWCFLGVIILIDGAGVTWQTARRWTWRDTGSLLLFLLVCLVASIAYHGRL